VDERPALSLGNVAAVFQVTMAMNRLNRVSFLLVSLLAVRPGFAEEPAPVRVEQGLVQGTSENGLTVYRGIPFAAPPLGEFRWRAPQLAHGAWGATNVLPRDVQNGLEDAGNKYCYWDGQIIKASDGKYHMFASRWSELRGHNGWFGSVAVHAVSDSLTGPYLDKGLCWPNDQGGKGHNVTALALPDGRYAIVISETRPCEVYISNSLDGPWEHLGTITVEGEPKWHASNVAIMLRPDGNFEFVPRDGRIFFSDKGIRCISSRWPAWFVTTTARSSITSASPTTNRSANTCA
jgi:Carboxylesterase family